MIKRLFRIWLYCIAAFLSIAKTIFCEIGRVSSATVRDTGLIPIRTL